MEISINFQGNFHGLGQLVISLLLSVKISVPGGFRNICMAQTLTTHLTFGSRLDNLVFFFFLHRLYMNRALLVFGQLCKLKPTVECIKRHVITLSLLSPSSRKTKFSTMPASNLPKIIFVLGAPGKQDLFTSL